MSDSQDFVEVDTAAGRVRGRWRPASGAGDFARSAAFLGIPFAEPPVGALRFAAPVPHAPWQGVRDALEFGATAQRGDQGITLIPEPSIPGDSTLNVNVFTSSPTPDAKLPVLVWIHGGGYIAGSPASPWYDGRNFNRDGVVTVSLSYRLGFDGFGWIEDAPANRGVRDWLLGLEWVQENIAAFGGDPQRVTIAGQSAGGGAVLTLLGMESAQHLFHAAYALSGALADIPLQRAEALARRLAAEAAVAPAREGFTSLTEERLLELQKVATSDVRKVIGTGPDSGMQFGPVIDGEVIRRPTSESLRAGVGADKPLVLGAVDDEFTMAFRDAETKLRWVPRRILLNQLGLRPKQQKGYIAANAEVAALGNARLAGRLISDRIFRAPVVQRIADRGTAPTWAYRFSWPAPEMGIAMHCLDVPFFFDCLDAESITNIAGPNPPQALADELHAAAVAFVQLGDPGWPQYSTNQLAKVWDTPSFDLPHAYASTSALELSS